jgi:hypothetical protein
VSQPISPAARPVWQRKPHLFFLLALFAANGCGGRGESPARPADTPEVLALIDRLQEVGDQGAGTHTTALAEGFIATDEELRFGGGVLGSPRPVVHPALRDLVRLGVAALPDLLDHLSDSRETRLVVGGKKVFGANWFSTEYHARYRDPGRRPAGVDQSSDQDREKQFQDEYTLRVGDLCFVAVGQIVNRGLRAVRYQPTACLVVNSPVKTPALAAAARQDWTGLTPEQHRQSLVEDLVDDYPHAEPEALKRLLFYYPEEGMPVALRLLSRPLSDWAATKRQADLIEGLAGLRSSELDEAVVGVFRSLDPGHYEGFDRLGADDLALACMDRLAGKDMDKEFAAYCERRVGELRGRPRQLAEDQRLEFLEKRLRLLGGGGGGWMSSRKRPSPSGTNRTRVDPPPPHGGTPPTPPQSHPQQHPLTRPRFCGPSAT